MKPWTVAPAGEPFRFDSTNNRAGEQHAIHPHLIELALTRRRDVRVWCRENGLLAAELAGPLHVDLESATITATTTRPAGGQEAEDFPEPATDNDGNLLTTERTVDLVTDVPEWLRKLSEGHLTDQRSTAA